jgi:hypothetical protein
MYRPGLRCMRRPPLKLAGSSPSLASRAYDLSNPSWLAHIEAVALGVGDGRVAYAIAHSLNGAGGDAAL